MISARKFGPWALLSFLAAEAKCLAASNVTDPSVICQIFRNTYPDLTYFSNETAYEARNEAFWTAAEFLGPACIFAPSSAELMSFAIKTLATTSVPFAVQGGGHMPIAGSANIDSTGVTISCTNLNQLILSEDQSTMSVGPGNHWEDVYNYLEYTGKTITGGRMGVVGVPGFILGGGITFFGNEYGWASANIASFETVLADGSIVNATADNEYSDLFWALRGGGNSFGIVTNFAMKTIEAPGVTVGQVEYQGSDLKDQFLQAVIDFAYTGILDQKSAVTPTISWSYAQYGSNDLAYSAMVFYNANNTNPAALTNFTGEGETSLPVNSSTFAYRNMKVWSDEIDTGFNQTHGLFFRFHIVSLYARLDALEVVFDTFFNVTSERLANVTGALTTLATMPVSESYIVNNRGNVSGDPMGIDASKAPYIWIEETFMYAESSDTDYINTVMAEVNAAIQANLEPLGDVQSPYLYLNDADLGQPVFEGYNQDNVARLKEIRAKYDPSGILTTQLVGGWKVESV